MNTQYDNIVNIMNGDISGIDSDSLNERAIMSSMLRNTSTDFKPLLFEARPEASQNRVSVSNTNSPNGISYEFSDLLTRSTRYYDKNMSIYNELSNEIVDFEILAQIYTQKALKYFFLLDVLSSFYQSLIEKKNNVVTIRTRYILTMHNMNWTHYTTDASDKFFSFDIQYDKNNLSNFIITNVKGHNVETIAIEKMCAVFHHDIVRHLSFLDKIDIVNGETQYLQHIVLLYKLCKLKMQYHCVGHDAGFENVISNCIDNISRKIIAIPINSSIEQKTIDMYDKTSEFQRTIESNANKMKQNHNLHESKEKHYRKSMIYVMILLAISFITILYVTMNFSLDPDMFSVLVIVILLMLYAAIHKINIEGVLENFAQESEIQNKFISVRDKIYNNILILVQNTSNDIALLSINNTYNRTNAINNASEIHLSYSKGRINEKKIYYAFVSQTLNFILRLILSTLIIYVFTYIWSIEFFYMLPGMYIVLFISYSMSMLKIVRTRRENTYWTPPTTKEL